VRIENHGRDKHRRTLGTVFDGDLNVNLELVKEGWCWWFRKFVPRDKPLRQFEQETKEAKRGIMGRPKSGAQGYIVALRQGPTHSLDDR
jgi:endonuclease YncB( thermonuclease family)